MVEQPLNEALEYVNHVKRTGIVMSMLAALVASLLSIIIAGMMTKRITNIAAITDHLATGNMNASLKVTSNDEIGQLALAFNKMVVQLKASRTELRDSEEKYRSLVENSNVGVYRKTGNDNSFIEYANPALAKMFGFPSVEELLQASAIQFSDQESFKLLIEEIDQQGAVKEREIRLKKKDGTSVWCSVTSIKHFDEKRQVFLIDSVVKDITERKIAEEALRQVHADLEIKVNERTQELRVLNEKLYRLSLEDGLTGIANRRCFDEFLQREWQRARREQLPLALIMLDVDLFKHYNDTYGHVSGDECLKRVAGVIKEVAKRATDLAARYGGEEFAIVLPNTDQANAVKLGNEILVGVRELGIRNATAVSSQIVTISLGIAVIIPSDITTPESLIIAADQALYQAKNAGRNQLQVASTNT
ncbi:MAG: diguanylate cyclase with sensor [Firmicutes bacterium]|nr:diguanylate cyclase with sensor [Bacillota bacterium]